MLRFQNYNSSPPKRDRRVLKCALQLYFQSQWSALGSPIISSSATCTQSLSVHWALHKSQKGSPPPLFNSNPRSISNQQHYIGNHQNLLKEKKANFHRLSVHGNPSLIHVGILDWCPSASQIVFVYQDQVPSWYAARAYGCQRLWILKLPRFTWFWVLLLSTEGIFPLISALLDQICFWHYFSCNHRANAQLLCYSAVNLQMKGKITHHLQGSQRVNHYITIRFVW